MRRLLAVMCLLVLTAAWSCRTNPPPVPSDDPKADEPPASETAGDDVDGADGADDVDGADER